MLTHLESRLGLSFVKKRGTNSQFYEARLPTSTVEIVVVGRMKNTATPPRPGENWLLRVEGAPPELVNELERFFKEGSKLTRVMSNGKLRLQWKSADYRGGLPGY